MADCLATAEAATGRLALVVAYDGTGYRGFQWQPGCPTIQGDLELAWRRLTGRSERLVAASRTDAGAHAWGQVVSLPRAEQILLGSYRSALNNVLPPGIVVRYVTPVDGSFHARRSAESRRYRYSWLTGETPNPFLARTAWYWRGSLDVDLMDWLARRLARELTPGAWAPGQRLLGASAWRRGPLVRFQVEANYFVAHQVRAMAGALWWVGRGLCDPDAMLSRLARGLQGLPVLPAGGLCLMEVRYADGVPLLAEEEDEDVLA